MEVKPPCVESDCRIFLSFSLMMLCGCEGFSLVATQRWILFADWTQSYKPAFCTCFSGSRERFHSLLPSQKNNNNNTCCITQLFFGIPKVYILVVEKKIFLHIQGEKLLFFNTETGRDHREGGWGRERPPGQTVASLKEADQPLGSQSTLIVGGKFSDSVWTTPLQELRQEVETLSSGWSASEEQQPVFNAVLN